MMTIYKTASDSKKQATSLKLRVFLVSLAWIALALAATGYVLNQLFEHHVRQQYQQQLQVYADYVLTGIDFPVDGMPQLDQSPQNPRFLTPLSGLYWQLNNEQGHAILRSRSLWDEQLDAPNDVLGAGQVHFHMMPGPQGKEVLLLEQTIRFQASPDRRWRLLVAEDAQALMSSIGDWQQMLVTFLFVLFISLGLAALAQIVVGLSPLRRLQESIRRLQAGDTSRLEGVYPSEFSGLVKGFNDVLDANERVIARARAQAGDLAHAIKTPLTVMSTALDQIDQKASGDPDLYRLFREQIETMRAQVDWRLRRARAGAQVTGVPGRSCLIGPVLDQLTRVMEKLYGPRGVRFELEKLPHEMRFAGESQDLAEIIGNLLDNGGKFANSLVRISVQGDARKLYVEIEDDGPGIAMERRAQVLRRGVRMDEEIPGAGLGLAIVHDLVQLYRGSLELQSSSLGGLSVRLELPGRLA